jgi:hypothetical protein
MNQGSIYLLIGGLVTAVAWIAFAEHPTARNFRRAAIDTLEFLG